MGKRSLTFGLATILTFGMCAGLELNSDNQFINPDDYVDNPSVSYLGEGEDEQVVIPTDLKINYQLDGASNADAYTNKRFYVWAGGQDGIEYVAEGVDDFGMYITVHPKDDFPTHNTFNFIIKNKGTWQGQSTDTTISYEKFVADENGFLEVWTIDGEGGSVEVYATIEETQGGKITYAKATDWKTFKVIGTETIKSYTLYGLTPAYQRLNADLQVKNLDNYIILQGDANATQFEVSVPTTLRPNVTYRIKVNFTSNVDRFKSKNIGMEPLYETKRFEEFYTYDGNDLGVTLEENKTTFKLWAPVCSRVVMRLYRYGTPSYIREGLPFYYDSYVSYEMSFCAGGVWSVSIDKNLAARYFTYEVTNSEGTSEVVDPYVRSAGVNGIRGQIVDLDATDPEGWDNIPLVWDQKDGFDISTPQELTPYEIHIRDLTMDNTWNGSETPGTYNAFVEKGTTYTKNGTTVTTGFDHIEELGVNAVQILPFFDQDNSEVSMKFNWGYNPLNYNVVEGGYSSDSENGYTRITEFKKLVMAFANNANHCRVIMDVVYNHVSSVSASNFTKICPKYYFRVNSDGYYTTGSGCGNEIRTEATMMSKFIVDSVSYWASEFKIKGFRFDLMGLIDVNTMGACKDALYNIDPDNVCWGEGWTGESYAGKIPGATKDQIYSTLYPSTTSPGILGSFNDDGRNAVRGGNDSGYGTNNPYPGYGFISQGSENVGGASSTVAAMLYGASNVGANPVQTVNYVSCHDNYTAWDQLNWTLSDSPSGTDASKEPDPLVVANASVATHASVMYSQGVAFIQGGEELFRTKINDSDEVRPYPDYPAYDPTGESETATPDVRMFGKVISHNSYRSSDECNSFKWDRKISIDYNGVSKDMTPYFESFKQMIKDHKEFIHLSFPENTTNKADGGLVSTWGTESGSTIFGIHINKGKQYVILFSGRGNSSISFGNVSTAKLLFNSMRGTTGISVSDTNVSLNKYQLVVYQLSA